MTDYTPDYWQVLKIENDGETILKVFGTWVGGFTTGESWKLNSGITSVDVTEKVITFHGFSGSKYVVPNSDSVYRTTAYSHSVIEQMKKNADKAGASIEVMPFDTDWSSLDYLKL